MTYRAGWSPRGEQRLEQLLQGAPDPEVLAAAAREIDQWLLADLYDPDMMPANLREARERNDETLERIYSGRHFRNDTERLEKLFERTRR